MPVGYGSQNPYVQLLQSQPNYNNGSKTGGLASILQQALLGYMMGRDQGQQTDANKALMAGLMGNQTTYDPTGTGPMGGQPQTYGTPGSLASALKNMQGMSDNPYAGRMAQQLMMQQAVSGIESQQKAADMAKQFEYAKLLKSAPGAAPQTADITNYEYAKKTGATTLSFDDWRKEEAGQAKYGNTPFYALGPDNRLAIFQPSSAGGAAEIKLPDGYRPLPGGIDYKDGGDVIYGFDKVGNLVGTIPKGTPGQLKINENTVVRAPGQSGGAPTGRFAPPSGLGVPGGPMSRPAPGFNPNALPPIPGPAGAGSPPMGNQPPMPPSAAPPPAMAPGQPTITDLPQSAANAAKAASQAEQKGKYASIVTEDIDRAKTAIADASFPVTGFWGGTTSKIPGTPAYNLARLLDTIKANAGFDRLQEMRNASTTGGALGQVSDFENKLLQATIGNLEQSQDKEQLLYNLDRVKKIYGKIVNEGIKPGDPLAGGQSSGGGIKFLGFE